MGFAEGFSSGMNAVTSARARADEAERARAMMAIQQQQEARAQQEFDARQADANRVRGLRMQLDDSLSGINPNQDGGSAFMGPPSDNAQKPVPGYAADPRQTLGLRQRLAVAQGQDLAPLNAEAKNYRVGDIYESRGKEWKGMSKEDKHAWIAGHTSNTDIPLYGTPTKNGKYTVFAQGRPAVELSDAEMEHLYVAEGLMHEDPQGALAIMEKGSAQLRNLAKDLMGIQMQTAGVNNQAAHFAATDANQAAHLGIARQQADAMRLGHAIQAEDEKGNPLIYVPTATKGGKFEFQQLGLPPGARFPSKGGAMGPKDENVLKLAEQLVGTPMAEQNETGGHDKHTPATALAEAYRQLSSLRTPGGVGGAGGPAFDPSNDAKLIKKQKLAPATLTDKFQAMPLDQLRDIARGGNPQALQTLKERLYHGAPEEAVPEEIPQRRGMVIDRGY